MKTSKTLRRSVNELNEVMHRNNLYIDNSPHRTRVINARVRGGQIVVEALHSGEDIVLTPDTKLLDGYCYPVEF